MFRKTIIGLVATAASLGAIVPAAAQAQYYGDYPARYERGNDRGYTQPIQYRGDRRYNRNRDYRRGRGNRCYDRGNGGLAIGGIAGGLLGNQIAGRGDKTLGAVLGAAAGALAGRAIDRSDGARC